MFVHHRRDRLQLFEPLDPALRLACLGGLVAEAVDESLDALALGLLMRAHGGIERAFLLARFDENVVAAGIQRKLAVLEMENRIHRTSQEVAVMTDQNHRAAVALEK